MVTSINYIFFVISYLDLICRGSPNKYLYLFSNDAENL